jgi:hypothetical protein
MNITEAMLTVRNFYGMSPRKSILIRGKHGIGKSSIVYQVAEQMSLELEKEKPGSIFGVIEIRLGQFEVGDLIGLPRTQPTYTVERSYYEKGKLVKKEETITDVTIHDLPQWMPRDPNYKGILFFDEINRGTKDTRQWAFQIVLDYKTNFKDVPKGIQIVAACNDNLETYQIGEFDQSFLDRFFVIDLKPTIREFLDYAEKMQAHPAVTMYTEKTNGNNLDAPDTMEPDKRYQSRRSWLALSDTMKHFKARGLDLHDFSADGRKDYFIKVASGWLGSMTAMPFVSYIEKEFQVFSAEQILNEYPKHRKIFKKMIITDYGHYNEVILKYLDKKKTMTEEQMNNLYLFWRDMPNEGAGVFWNQFRIRCEPLSEKWFRTLDIKNKLGSSEIRDYLSKDLLATDGLLGNLQDKPKDKDSK